MAVLLGRGLGVLLPVRGSCYSFLASSAFWLELLVPSICYIRSDSVLLLPTRFIDTDLFNFTAPASPTSAALPTVEQIKAKIPATGISMADLLIQFPGVINTPERKTEFQALLKRTTRFDKARKVLLPL